MPKTSLVTKKDIKRFLFLLIFIASLVLFFDFSNGLRNNIEEGKTSYCQGIGYVNWNHAKPSGAKLAYDSFLIKNQSVLDSFEITYSQIVVSEISSIKVIVAKEQSFKVSSGLSKEEARVVFLTMFMSVSEEFEEMQGSFPMLLAFGSRGSSFRNGDLMGDLISFYCATSGVSLKDVKSEMKVFSIEKSLVKSNNSNTAEKEYNWLSFLSEDGDNSLKDSISSLINEANEASVKKRFRLLHTKTKVYTDMK